MGKPCDFKPFLHGYPSFFTGSFKNTLLAACRPFTATGAGNLTFIGVEWQFGSNKLAELDCIIVHTLVSSIQLQPTWPN